MGELYLFLSRSRIDATIFKEIYIIHHKKALNQMNLLNPLTVS